MTAPQRIHLSRAKGWRMPENTVKVDRSTAFGNPFPIRKVVAISCGLSNHLWLVGDTAGSRQCWQAASREAAQDLSVRLFRAWIGSPSRAPLRATVGTHLAGKNLACWCSLDAPCHADALLGIANGFTCEGAV